MPVSRRKDWSGRPDLNRRPTAPKRGGLRKLRSTLLGNNHELADQRYKI